MLKFKEKKFLIKDVNYNGQYKTLCFECIRITGTRNKPKIYSATYAMFDKNGKVIGESVDIVKHAGFSEEEIQKYIDYYKKYHKVYKEDKNKNPEEVDYSQASKFNKQYSDTSQAWEEKMNNCKSLNELSDLCADMYLVHNINPYLYESTINKIIQKLFVKDPFFYKSQNNSDVDNVEFMYKMKFVYQACQMENETFENANILDKEKYMKDAFYYMLNELYTEPFTSDKEEILYCEVYSLFEKYNYSIEALEANYSRYEAKQNIPEKIQPFINAYLNRLSVFKLKCKMNCNDFWAEILLAKETNDLLALSRARILIDSEEKFKEWNDVKNEFLQNDFDGNHYFLARRCFYNDAENIDVILLSMLYCVESIKPIDEKKMIDFHKDLYYLFGFYGIDEKINNLGLISEVLDEVYFNYNNYYDDKTNEAYKKARKEINEILKRQ